jgi:TetR/AcrR family transcriptional repressor of nem operon
LSGALSSGSEDDRRRFAIGTWSAMVGAVILARAIEDPALSEEMLQQTRAWIDAELGRLATET